MPTPSAHLDRFGAARSALLTIDGLGPDPAAVTAIAAALAPFPPAQGNAYPGQRRFITTRDSDAVQYAQAMLRGAAPYINQVFDADGFDLLDASFSLVSVPAARLMAQQRAPHFDSTDPAYLAVLHYLSGVAGSGTGFYRQRATGIERVTDDNRAAFVAASRDEASAWDGYIGASNASFERIAAADAHPGRLIVYQGSVLHSGLIPDDACLSADPRQGRLTANFFVRLRPARRMSGG